MLVKALPRDVDRHRNHVASILPFPALAERGVDCPLREVSDQPGPLGEWNEQVGKHHPIPVVPSGERLDSDDGPGSKVNFRLVVELEHVRVDRLTELDAERERLRVDVLELGGEDAETDSFTLCPVHRGVGPSEKRCSVFSVLGEDRDPDARPDLEPLIFDLERILKGVDDPACRSEGLSGVADRWQHERELVPAHPGDGLTGAELLAKPFRYLLQQLVPVVVTEGVVDLLEAVEIHHQQPDELRALFFLRSVNRFFELLHQQSPIREIRENVVKRLVLE